MITSNLKFNDTSKDRLFYNRYLYSVSCFLQEASALRNLSHRNIDRTIQYRMQYTHSALYRQHRNNQSIADEVSNNLHSFCDTLMEFEGDYKLVISCNWMAIYTDNLQLLDKIDQVNYIQQKYYRKAVVDRPMDTIALKNPTHTNRSYFKEKVFTSQQKETLNNFLLAQKDNIRIGPGLKGWFDRNNNPYSMSYFFIDHSSDQWITMLSLVHPGLIRKTVKIIQDK